MWRRDVLPCDLTTRWLALWAFHLGPTDGVHDNLRVDATASTIGLVDELAVHEKEDNKVTANSSTI